MKYTDTQIGFQEFPDEISLLINISNCPFHCPGCHSPELWEDVGTELTFDELDKLIQSNKGITCVGFMGGKEEEVNKLSRFIKDKYPKLKVGVYSGGYSVVHFDFEVLDYIKVGSYMEEYGPLNNPNTNQKMFKLVPNSSKYIKDKNRFKEMIDITYKFWKHGNNK